MGLLIGGALSTLVKADEELLIPVPDEWTLEEAATVPVVYLTVLYALIKVNLEFIHKEISFAPFYFRKAKFEKVKAS